MTNGWFWTGIGLVLAFFLATLTVERTLIGRGVLSGLDRVSAPLWSRSDDFMRAAIGGFFVAIFAVGGIYLTPDLKTNSELVSWAQLLIAACVFSRRTMPIAAAGIISLWVVALREYDLFHLLDYLALGVGVAAYLVLASTDDPEWRARRFVALRWGIAIALMWSSLEKFAYPDWFYPLVEEKPFLTFGMPRDVFIPMAGVAEFTLGFGLLWTPLVRRLSAVSLLLIFFTAVYPFGRVDLVGHALIMAALFLVAADPCRGAKALTVKMPTTLPRVGNLASVPAGLAVALGVLVTSYWGLHGVFYDTRSMAESALLTTHSASPEYPHGSQATLPVNQHHH
ncbi:membrane protein [Microvirga vignae]|uniref:Membrane protein n=1 Tax=Microvirga vignae TaxID=1225564 RepID=A0A0H1RET3_9HYPH|nr:membrane protein [Microvirga vignae]